MKRGARKNLRHWFADEFLEFQYLCVMRVCFVCSVMNVIVVQKFCMDFPVCLAVWERVILLGSATMNEI